jgi:outer membrane protein assembly factor BamB
MTGLQRGAWVAPFAMVCALACSSSGDDDDNPANTAATGGSVPSGGVGGPAGGSTAMGGVPGGGTGATPGGAGGQVTSGAGGVSGGAGGAPGGNSGGGTGGTTTPPVSADSWTMMGGDARNTYHNAAEKKLTVENAPMIEELWTKTVAGYPPGSPLVVDGKVFVMATGGTYAFDLATGNELWNNLEIKGTASLAYDGEFLYAHANAPVKAALYKLNPADGKQVWGPTVTYTHANADATSSPIVGGGKVIVGHSTTAEIGGDAATGRGGVFAAHTDSGMEAWHYWTTGGPDSMENGAMVWSTVSIHEGVVYASTGNNYTVGGPNSDAIHALDLATGVKKWVKQVRMGDIWILFAPISEDTDFGANPIIADFGGKKLVAAGDKASAFWTLDRDTGNILWSRTDLSPSNFAANGGVLNNGAFDGTAFYVISNDPTGGKSMLHKLNPDDGKDMWPMITYPKMTWGAPSVANGLLVVPVDNELVIINAATGTEIKRFDTGGSIAAGAPAIVDGRIVVKSGLEYPLGTPMPNNEIKAYGLK